MGSAHIIGRRPMLAGAVALCAAPVLPTGGIAATAPALDLSTPAARGALYRKMAWRADEGIGFYWLQGTRYGLVDAVMTPFWDMLFGLIFKVQDHGDGRYDVTTIPTSFYTDPSTGALLHKFANPYTGKTVDVSYFPAKPSTAKFDAGGPMPAPAAPGMVATSTVAPAAIDGGEVWLRADNRFAGTAPGPEGRKFSVNDITTFNATVAELVSPSPAMVSSRLMFSDILTYSSWLEMGDHPGFMYSLCHGRKVASINEMPALWQTLMKQEHADLYKDPAGAFGA